MKHTMIFFPHRPFELGDITIAKEVTASLDLNVITDALLRHSWGDWGDLSHDDWQQNQQALRNGERVWSRYVTSVNDFEFRIVTEADRSFTTVFTIGDER
jgi:hypothetical protein